MAYSPAASCDEPSSVHGLRESEQYMSYIKSTNNSSPALLHHNQLQPQHPNPNTQHPLVLGRTPGLSATCVAKSAIVVLAV
jgi:hypothetical protein